MAYDLAAAYLRTGIPTSPDADVLLQGELDVALAIVEQYLDRLLLFASGEVEVLMVHQPSIQVTRFPIADVASISNAPSTAVGPPVGSPINHGVYEIHNDAGLILFTHPIVSRRVVVEYSGGYQDLPADLLLALWAVFDAVHAVNDPAGAGSGGLQAGAVESVTLTGVGTVRFASGASAAAAVASDPDANSLIPAWARLLLDPYRLRKA